MFAFYNCITVLLFKCVFYMLLMHNKWMHGLFDEYHCYVDWIFMMNYLQEWRWHYQHSLKAETLVTEATSLALVLILMPKDQMCFMMCASVYCWLLLVVIIWH